MLTITLAGQAMIRSDLRIDAPDAQPAIKSLITGDVAVTNYEAAVFDPRKGETFRSGRFASPASTVDVLKELGFNVLTLCNNHSYDLKESGVLNTLDAADAAGVAHAGVGRSVEAADAPCFVDTKGARVGVVAFASGLVHDGRATPDRPGVNELRVDGEIPDADDAERLLQRVREARAQADIVIASHHNHHYPGVERPADFKQLLLSQLPARLAPPAWLEPWARRLVDAGADVVAMHGPPFLHGMELYKGKPIFYSLGNFMFQAPPESIHLEEPIMWESVVADLEFSGGDLREIKFRPIAMNKIGRGMPNPHDQFDVNEYHRTRGLPSPALGKQALYLLERFAALSSPYGVKIEVQGEMARLACA